MTTTTESTRLTVKCLLVDDLEDNLLVMSALLRQQGLEILTARSGAAALELLLVHDVALAFLDVQMPEMDGFELAELMRGSARTRDIPIIFVTAGLRDQRRLFEGYEAGAVDFLYKPIEPDILRSKADVFFQLYRQKHQLAHELKERTETLRLNEMFTAVLGHDLRNPLSAIVMMAKILEQRTDDAATREIAARMLLTGKRMSRLIEDVLDLARARLGGGIGITRATTDLGTVATAVVQEHQAAAPDREIEFATGGDLRGEWDGDRLGQVIANLLANALQHGADGTKVKVQLDGSRVESVAIAVENSGRIPSEVLSRIFEPFRGGTRPPGRREGLGLGLYIVLQIVETHGGRIDVQSGEDNLTRITVSVPRAPGRE